MVQKELNMALVGAVGLLLLAVVIGVGSSVLDEISDTQLETGAFQVTNETINSSINGVNTTIIFSNTPFDNTSVVVIGPTNGTGEIDDDSGAHEVIVQGDGDVLNYTLSPTGINFTGPSISLPAQQNAIYNVSYSATKTEFTFAFNASQEGLAGIDTFAGFQPTIAVIVILFIIVSLLIGGLVVLALRSRIF